MAKKSDEKAADNERRVPRDAPPPESKTDEQRQQEAADAEKAEQERQRDKKPERRQTYGIARQLDGGVLLNIGSEEVTLTEEEWLRLVANASAGGAGNDRIPALMDFHRSEGDVGFVNKG